MNKIYFILFLFSANCFGQNSDVDKSLNLPKIEAYINDFEGILEVHQEVILKTSVESFAKENNVGIVVITVDSIQSYETIFDYSLALANRIDFACVLLVVSKNIKQIQIQNCNRIQNKLTNDETKSIMENYIIPEFKKDNYFKGLLKGISQIKKELQ